MVFYGCLAGMLIISAQVCGTRFAPPPFVHCYVCSCQIHPDFLKVSVLLMSFLFDFVFPALYSSKLLSFEMYRPTN